MRREEVGDAGEVGRAGPAVDERDAVEEHRRRERAEQEVLEPGLLRRGAAAVERGEHVQRDREDLERQEDRDEVVGRRHQHHAGGRAQHQREVLGPFEVLAFQVARREQQREQRRDAARPSARTPRTRRPRPCRPRAPGTGRRPARSAHWTPVNTAAVTHAGDRGRQRRLVHARVVADERAAEHDDERGPNSAISGAIANQSIDGAVMCVTGAEHADHLPRLRSTRTAGRRRSPRGRVCESSGIVSRPLASAMQLVALGRPRAPCGCCACRPG